MKDTDRGGLAIRIKDTDRGGLPLRIKDTDRGGLLQRSKDTDRGVSGSNGRQSTNGAETITDLLHRASQLGGFFVVGFVTPVGPSSNSPAGLSAKQRALIDIATDGVRIERHAVETETIAREAARKTASLAKTPPKAAGRRKRPRAAAKKR